MTNPAGGIGYSANYDPYGNPLEQFGTAKPSLGFTGEYTDPSGLLLDAIALHEKAPLMWGFHFRVFRPACKPPSVKTQYKCHLPDLCNVH